MTGLATPLATPVDLGGAWNASDEEVAERLHPDYRDALRRLPEGDVIIRGLPFGLGRRAAGRRWLVVEGEIRLPLPLGGASHLVVAHFADSTRGADGERPPGAPVGWVVGAGELLATYTVRGVGAVREVPIRRRHEIGDGIVGWGSLPFAAVHHREDQVLDWRGPHPALPPGGYAAAGMAGALSILPGSWGAAQTGVADFVPSPDGDVMLWLHAIALEPGLEPHEVVLRAAGEQAPGSTVVVAGMTLFDGTADPLVLAPRRQVFVTGFGGGLPEADLGVAIRALPLLDQPITRIVGWGRTSPGEPPPLRPDGATVVDLALAPDARLRFGDWSIPAAALEAGAADAATGVRVVPLPSRDIRVRVRIADGTTGEPTPARVRFVAQDGRYLPPVAHRDEVDPGLYEDVGADILLGRDVYAYVSGEFEIDLPAGRVDVEVVRGFDSRPLATSIEVDARTLELPLTLEPALDLRSRGWVTADPHVHFLAPSTALLQAAAEDVGLVHLLATQWGDLFTNITDLPWGGLHDPSGRHAVVLGTENRQNMLGHVGLLGAHRPILPLASGGAPEGHIAGAVTRLMADWMDRCREEGGLVVSSHFPLPYAEVASDIVMGKVDAVEMQTFPPRFDTPSILEWYRFLNLGYRLPVVGGTDKMTAEIPLGAIRTYARLEPDQPLTFESWAAAVRAGRTFATSGPSIELLVDGREPGEAIAMGRGGGTLEVVARARAAQPVIAAVELVVNGRVVDAREAAGETDDLELAATIEVRESAWIAARVRSDREIHSAFATAMAAHSSPVYVEVADRPLFVATDAEAILPIVEGTLRWLRDRAAVPTAAERARMVAFVEESAHRLRRRIEESGGTAR